MAINVDEMGMKRYHHITSNGVMKLCFCSVQYVPESNKNPPYGEMIFDLAILSLMSRLPFGDVLELSCITIN